MSTLTSYIAGFVSSCILLVFAVDRVQSAALLYFAGFITAVVIAVWLAVVFHLWPHIHKSVVGVRKGHVPTGKYLRRGHRGGEQDKQLADAVVDLMTPVRRDVVGALVNLGMPREDARKTVTAAIQEVQRKQRPCDFESIFRECVQ